MNFTNKFKFRKNKGITLIALVITIIVLLILAGASIAMLTGQNGILKRTAQAKEETFDKQEEELVRLAVSSALTDGLAQENQITDENLRKEIKNAIGSDENLSGNGPWKYIGKKTYDISLNGVIENVVDWYEVLGNLQDTSKRKELLNEAQSLGQSNPNLDVGIGTDGNVVNLDLWKYRISNSGNGVGLQEDNGSVYASGYENVNITDDGEIQGKVPQYIFMYSKNKIYPVDSMRGTFYGCTRLKKAPTIPDAVIDMDETFEGCNNLEMAPMIPESVTSMGYTFRNCTEMTSASTIPDKVTYIRGTFTNCTSLTGNIAINANIIKTDEDSYAYCFDETIKPITISGTSTILQDLAKTSSNNNVTVQTE